VASCHSEFAGQIFHNAGAKHVICIREDQPISDDAAICFAKVFYNALFSSSKTVCEAFYIAQRHLSTHEDADLAREA
jgi:ATP-dependent Clp protease ATP-binding subunit ClpA